MDIYKYLNLNGVVDIVRLIADNSNISQASCTFENNGVNYQVCKKDNSISIKSDDGKYMQIEVDAISISDSNPDYKDIYISSMYLLNNNSYITMISHPMLEGNFSNLSSIARHNLFEEYTIDYSNSNKEIEGSVSLDFNQIRVYGKDGVSRRYSFTPNGIGNAEITTTLDGDTLLALDGNELPEDTVLMSFNPTMEKKKLHNSYDGEDIHPFMKEFIQYADDFIDRKKAYVDRISNYYAHEKNIIKKAIDIRNNLINSSNKMFTSEELNNCINGLQEDINKRKNNNEKNERDRVKVIKKSL